MASFTYRNILASGQFSDVVVTVGQGELAESFNLHRVLLSSRSEFFEKACGGTFQEAITGHVQLPEDDPFIFKKFIAFVYLGHFDEPEDAHNYADEYNVDLILGRAEQVPDDSNSTAVQDDMLMCCRVYVLADKLLVPDLKVQALQRLDYYIREAKNSIHDRSSVDDHMGMFTAVVDQVFGTSPTPFLEVAERICHFFYEIMTHSPNLWLRAVPELQRHREFLLGVWAYSQPPLRLWQGCDAAHCRHGTLVEPCECAGCGCDIAQEFYQTPGWNGMNASFRRERWIKQQKIRIKDEDQAAEESGEN